MLFSSKLEIFTKAAQCHRRINFLPPFTWALLYVPFKFCEKQEFGNLSKTGSMTLRSMPHNYPFRIQEFQQKPTLNKPHPHNSRSFNSGNISHLPFKSVHAKNPRELSQWERNGKTELKGGSESFWFLVNSLQNNCTHAQKQRTTHRSRNGQERFLLLCEQLKEGCAETTWCIDWYAIKINYDFNTQQLNKARSFAQRLYIKKKNKIIKPGWDWMGCNL